MPYRIRMKFSCIFCRAIIGHNHHRHLDICKTMSDNIHTLESARSMTSWLESIGLESQYRTNITLKVIAKTRGVNVPNVDMSKVMVPRFIGSKCKSCTILTSNKYCDDCSLRMQQEQSKKNGDMETYKKIFKYRWRFLLHL